MTAVILLDAADADAAPADAERAISLTPAAFAAAQRKVAIPCTPAVLTDIAHARCAAGAERALEQFDRATVDSELPGCLRVLARQSAWQLGALCQRLRRSLPPGKRWVRAREGAWLRSEDALSTQEVLLPRIFEWGLAHRTKARRPALPALYTRLLLLAARRSRGGRWAVTTDRKLKLGLDRELRNAGASIANFGMTRGGLRDYPPLIRAMMRRATLFNLCPVAPGDAELERAMSVLLDAEDAFTDSLVRSAWRLYMPYLRANGANAIAMLRMAPQLIRALGASLAVTYEGNSWLAAALLEAARRSGSRSAVVNHNSHPRTGSATADAVLGFLFHQRTANPLIDLSGQWSPQWKRWSDADAPTCHLPYRVRYPEAGAQRAQFRMLHAGNYQNWSDFIPWIAETSNEYVAGLARLANAVARVPGMELVIRVRTKPEVNPDIVRRAIGNATNVTVVDTSEDFLQQLAGSDLLVSHFSTTVEQALQMGKPVLLWGSARRYCQFPASRVPPTPSARAAVYAALDEAALIPMLMAIREQHWQRPLAREQLATYRNAEDSPDLSGIAARLIAGG